MRGDPRFRKLLDTLAELHEKKMADYGTGDDPFANVRQSAEFGVDPWVGALIRENDKTKRLQSFLKNGRLENESVQDSLMDKASYSLIALILYNEQHGEG